MRYLIQTLVVLLLIITFNYTCKENRSPIFEISLDESKYILPFPIGTSYYASQGFNGTVSHFGVFQYAVDFDMPIGSVITAAREGHVIFIEENFTDNDFGSGKENLVIIMHEDSTYARYVHLTHNGALVDSGAWVNVCDIVGLSGNSGYSGHPHLHFDVTKGCNDINCQTIPFFFKGIEEKYGLIKSGKYYCHN